MSYSTPEPRRRLGWRRTVAALTALAAALAVGLAGPAASRAYADSAPANPADPKTPPTVAIDVLPTVQHNGVAWNQLVLGNTVYVVGSFSRARPAGSAAGQNEVVRNNVLAYDLTTGALKSFNPNLNAQAFAIAASPDGSRIYVGGDFSTVGGAARSRIAALDPTTGALLSGTTTFNVNARADGSVRAIAATANTVYLGGSFSAVNGTSRQRLAAVNAGNGLLVGSFAPAMTGNVDSSPRVNALQLSPTGDRLVVGGNFVTLNGSNRPGYGLGMLNPATGASLAFAANNVVRNAGKDSAILSLSSDGTNVYGTGYIFGTGGNLEGSFAANWSNTAIKWVEDCHGDSYGVYASSTAVYVAGHPHYCLNLGGYNETQPPQRAIAFSKAATGVLTRDTRGYPSFTGQPAPSLLNFFPQLTTGTASGQSQAAWAVAGSGKYVVYAGEFRQVNGTPQQGMVRFATSELAANRQGPKASGTSFTPTLSSPGAGQARVNWTANYDYDNSDLTYTVLRDSLTTPVATITRSSTWWSRPAMTFTDTGLTAGSHSYRVRVVDPFGNSQTSPTVSITVAGGGNASPVGSDAFGRTVTSGFGSAQVGGAWTTSGSSFSVNGSQGLVSIATPGQGPWAQLAGVSSSSVDLTAGMVLDKRPNSGAAYGGTIGRRVGSNDYRLKVKVDSAGAVTLYAIRTSGGETALSTLIVPGLTYAPAARLDTRLQVTGTSPTTIRGKVWLSTAAEPSAWQVTATDSTAALQSSGSVGVHSYVSSSATNSPWVFRFDDLVARSI